MIRRLVEEWPEIKAPRVTEILRDDYGYSGSGDWSASGWLRCGHGRVRPAQRTGYAGRGSDAARLGRDADAAEDRRA